MGIFGNKKDKNKNRIGKLVREIERIFPKRVAEVVRQQQKNGEYDAIRNAFEKPLETFLGLDKRSKAYKEIVAQSKKAKSSNNQQDTEILIKLVSSLGSPQPQPQQEQPKRGRGRGRGRKQEPEPQVDQYEGLTHKQKFKKLKAEKIKLGADREEEFKEVTNKLVSYDAFLAEQKAHLQKKSDNKTKVLTEVEKQSNKREEDIAIADEVLSQYPRMLNIAKNNLSLAKKHLSILEDNIRSYGEELRVALSAEIAETTKKKIIAEAEIIKYKIEIQKAKDTKTFYQSKTKKLFKRAYIALFGGSVSVDELEAVRASVQAERSKNNRR